MRIRMQLYVYDIWRARPRIVDTYIHLRLTIQAHTIFVYINIYFYTECFKSPCSYQCHSFLKACRAKKHIRTSLFWTLHGETRAFKHLGWKIENIVRETIAIVSLRVDTQFLANVRVLEFLLITVHEIKRNFSCDSLKWTPSIKSNKSTKLWFFSTKSMLLSLFSPIFLEGINS